MQAIDFVSDRPEFAGTMTMTWSLTPAADGTLVSILAENVPIGIGRTDHELGMASSLENLARFVE
ncbi:MULTISPECIES: SRPBCC domain-containing protein [unclassified Bradyrhizobium]|uniref:SRPBCC domain-containing protein n=1 Tax=unclassified Bradyrhizobium TaxID=2631580 RepID=UPI00291698CC|nr:MULTISPECIES: SRPBCC domain-containing protein [unclassified Bradyrhizobium]